MSLPVLDEGEGEEHHSPAHLAGKERHLRLLTLGELPLARNIDQNYHFN